MNKIEETKKEFAKNGFTFCPLTNDQITQCVRAKTDPYLVGCDVNSGFPFEEALAANKPMTKAQTVKAIRDLGMRGTWSSEWGEWRVTFSQEEMPDRERREAVAAYTPDNDDALCMAWGMRLHAWRQWCIERALAFSIIGRNDEASLEARMIQVFNYQLGQEDINVRAKQHSY